MAAFARIGQPFSDFTSYTRPSELMRNCTSTLPVMWLCLAIAGYTGSVRAISVAGSISLFSSTKSAPPFTEGSGIEERFADELATEAPRGEGTGAEGAG